MYFTDIIKRFVILLNLNIDKTIQTIKVVEIIMAKIYIGVNMEFVRHSDKSFEWGVAKAAELGYEYVEPMVHWGRELLSEATYFHSVSMLDDPLRIKRACEKYGVKVSALSAHCPLCKPEVSVEYLKQAIRLPQSVVRL
jgi:sugar phosphate isomerase/epimerase